MYGLARMVSMRRRAYPPRVVAALPGAVGNLLFFAAWPMLAACLALYLLRDYDRLASIDARRGR